MGKIISLIGQRFGRLSVLSYSHKNNLSQPYWLCKCDCGENVTVNSGALKSGNTKSCGCLQKEIVSKNTFIDITNQRFSRLVVISFSHMQLNRSYWLCKCDCGKEKIIDGNNLKRGDTKSCGCLNEEKSKSRSVGKNNPNWRGGISKKSYPSEWTEKLKKEIRNRDNHKCQYLDCTYDDTKENRKLDVHHIDGNKQNCESYNLISLCGKHHTKIEHNNPELWIDYFYRITGDFYGS